MAMQTPETLEPCESCSTDRVKEGLLIVCNKPAINNKVWNRFQPAHLWKFDRFQIFSDCIIKQACIPLIYAIYWLSTRLHSYVWMG